MSKFFTVSIGNNGSIVLLNSKNRIIEHYFFTEIQSEENRQILLELFNHNKKIPIYFILDNIGQNYNIKTFPNVNFFDLKNIVNRKFKYNIPEDDLKEKRYLGYDKALKQWKYMFISSPVDGLLKEWIDFVGEIDNILNGVYMLPLESEKILKKLKQKLKIKNIKNKTYWDIILIRNGISGFREITFFNNKLVFTRILNEDLSDQEHFNTQFRENILRNIEYLKRFYSNFKEDKLNIYTITDEEVKTFIKESTIKNSLHIKAFSYEQFAGLFGLTKKINHFLDCGDIICEELIMFDKKIISFSTKEMKRLAIISNITGLLQKFVILLFTILFCIILFGSFSFIRNEFKIKKLNTDFKKATNTLENKKKQEFGEGISNIDDIINITVFYLQIKEVRKNPFDAVTKFASSITDSVITSSVKWKINKSSRDIIYGGKESLTFDSSLINKSGKIDDLFKIYDNTNQTLQTNLSNYNVKLSSLPKNINFNTTYYSFPLKIDLVEK